MKYFFWVGDNGRILKGCAGDFVGNFSEEGAVEGDEQVWLNQDRAFYISETWRIYPPLSISAPTVASVNGIVTAVATLPIGSPDTEVQFRVAWQDTNGVWHRTDPVSVVTTNSRASKDFQFTAAGKYMIEALSEHHGSISAEVVVS